MKRKAKRVLRSLFLAYSQLKVSAQLHLN